MALKAFVSDISGVPEALRQCYKQQEYGGYKIDGHDVEDVTRLKSALDRERAVLGMSSAPSGT